MVIKFDSGYGKELDIGIIGSVLNKVLLDNKSKGYTASGATMYVQLRDKDGYPDEDYTRDGNRIEMLVRNKPYKKLPARTELIEKLNLFSSETGEVVEEVYLYMRERSMKG